MRFKLCMFVTVFLIMAVIVVLLTWCVYLARRHQIEDFRTWVLVEGIPVVFVTTILLLLIWLVLGRM
jgi:glucan phosphoethanolaminetransferase (alkaline phosphatase superfamily)